jgi:hypothetical protein
VSAPAEITREEWWREYAAWQLGHRDGPVCVRCGATIPVERVMPWCLCEPCEAIDEVMREVE